MNLPLDTSSGREDLLRYHTEKLEDLLWELSADVAMLRLDQRETEGCPDLTYEVLAVGEESAVLSILAIRENLKYLGGQVADIAYCWG
jgi:hypothetical protein